MISGSVFTSSLGLGYRYGFNGKENDADVKGDGDQIDYGMRVYDPRLGRFLSLDPLQVKYPWYTPYQFAGNKPIVAIDKDGLEDHMFQMKVWKESGTTKFNIIHTRDYDAPLLNWLTQETWKVTWEGHGTIGFYNPSEIKFV